MKWDTYDELAVNIIPHSLLESEMNDFKSHTPPEFGGELTQQVRRGAYISSCQVLMILEHVILTHL